MDYSISVQNLKLNYGDSTVIENLNIHFKKNNFTTLVGNNGSGKSTFLQSLCNLHKDYTGDIIVNEKSISNSDDLFKQGEIAFLSQNHEISFDIKVRELLLMGRFRFKKTFENYSLDDINAIENIANQLNISSFLDKYFSELSGGEQQLVLIAQVLVQDAEIYLFDEPTQNLDLKNGHFIIDLISQLPQKNKTVICTTHDLHLLGNVSGEIVNFSSDKVENLKIGAESIKEQIDILKGIA